MASSPDSSDQSLLNRLNALKPTTISLKNSTHGLTLTSAPSTSTSTDEKKNLTGSTTTTTTSLSREDALAERLRVLRNNNSQPEPPKQSTTNSLSGSANQLPASSSSEGAQPQCPVTQLPQTGDNIQRGRHQTSDISSQKLPLSSDELLTTGGGASDGNQRGTNHAENPDNDDDDYLRYLESGDPDQTLDELLDGLDEEFDLDDDELSKFDPAREAKKVSDLLEQFQKDIKASGGSGDGGVPATKDDDGHAVTGKVSGERTRAPLKRAGGPRGNDDDHDDDSESEQMTRDVEKILSQVRDELGVDSEDKGDASKLEEEPVVSPATDSEASARSSTTIQGPSKEEGDSNTIPAAIAAALDSSLSLPDAPASPLREIDTTKVEDSNDGEENNNSNRKSFDFENDIVTRMASLRGLGSGINVDAFGLPVAPTFSPETHQGTNKKKKTTTGAAGYTDEDQKTWCIVCLDDATIRCVGCDNDVYCARCWRDMHVGPSAGYDERGHQWVKFVR